MSESLRTRVLRGGTFLIVRQGLGSLVSFVAVMLIVRAIGPAEYGLATAAIGVSTYALAVFSLGIGAFLIREAGELSREDCDQAFTCLVACGVLGLGAALGCVPLAARAIGLERFAPLAAAACAIIPISVVANFPLALLERALDYRRVAFIELASQTSGHLVALALTFQGFGAFALVGGLWMREASACVLLFRAAGYAPRLRLDGPRARRIMGYGISYGVAGWVWQSGYVVIPIVISRLAGAEVLGVVTLANRFLEHLSFIAGITRRLGFAALAKVQADREKLARLCSEAMVVQVLAIGFLVVAFGVGAPFVLPSVLGARWEGVPLIYPFLALGALVDATFSFHVQILHILKRNLDVVACHTTRRLLTLAGLVVLLPRFGLVGCGYTELVGLIGFPIIHAFLARQGLRLRYGEPLALLLLFSVALFHREGGWPLALLPLAVLAWPGTWRLVREQVRAFHGEPARAEAPAAEAAIP